MGNLKIYMNQLDFCSVAEDVWCYKSVQTAVALKNIRFVFDLVPHNQIQYGCRFFHSLALDVNCDLIVVLFICFSHFILIFYSS